MATRLDPWDRTCPDCNTTFASVQGWGVCPNCDLRFGVDAVGTVIVSGDRPSDRSIPTVLFVPPQIDDLVCLLPKNIVARVNLEFSTEDAPEVLRLLACYGTRSHETGADHIRSVILDRAKGYLPGVESLMLIAQSDWRDILT